MSVTGLFVNPIHPLLPCPLHYRSAPPRCRHITPNTCRRTRQSIHLFIQVTQLPLKGHWLACRPSRSSVKSYFPSGKQTNRKPRIVTPASSPHLRQLRVCAKLQPSTGCGAWHSSPKIQCTLVQRKHTAVKDITPSAGPSIPETISTFDSTIREKSSKFPPARSPSWHPQA